MKNLKAGIPCVFSERSLKPEDKILLGIGVIFLTCVLFFITFTKILFDDFAKDEQKLKQSSASINQPKQKDEFELLFETIHKESEEAFQRVAKAFEENSRKRDEAFKQMKQNFKERFNKVKGENDAWMKRIHKIMDESARKSDKEWEKTMAKYSVGLPNYAHGIPKNKSKEKQQ